MKRSELIAAFNEMLNNSEAVRAQTKLELQASIKKSQRTTLALSAMSKAEYDATYL